MLGLLVSLLLYDNLAYGPPPTLSRQPHAQPVRPKPERLLLSKENVYSGGYNVTSAGSFEVSVVWDATAGGRRQVQGEKYPHIRNSPFEIEIVAGQTSPAHSSTVGDCKHKAHAHQVCSFSLVLRDAYSNARRSGGDLVAAMLQGPETVSDRAGDGPRGDALPVTIRGNRWRALALRALWRTSRFRIAEEH